MKLLYVPVIILAIALLTVSPVCAGKSPGAVSGENIPESFFITIDPIGDHYSGDTILMQGSTNLHNSDTLLVEVYSSAYHPGIHGVSYGISRTVAIIPGRNDTTNRWSIEVTTIDWRQDEYLVTVDPANDTHTHDRGYATGLFNLFSADKRPAENLTPVTTALPSLPVLATNSITPVRIGAPTQPAPLSAMITITAISGFVVIAGLKKDRGLK
ncbi:MAG: hypothetical protein WCX22_04755 [Methanoregula sp.]